MAKPIDPDKLVSLPKIANEYGYNSKHLSRLASEGKLRAWLVGHSWVTVREEMEVYLKSNPAPGRPVQKAKSQKSKRQK